MQALCDLNGIRYAHYLQPNQYLPGSKGLNSEELQNAYDAESPYRAVVEEGYPLLRQAGRELEAAGVDFHDLSLIFEGLARRSKTGILAFSLSESFSSSLSVMEPISIGSAAISVDK